MRKLAFRHIFFDKRWLHAIQAEDDESVNVAFFIGPLSFYDPHEKAKRPGEEGKKSQNKSQKNDKERREKRKTCARPHISMERAGKDKEKKDYKKKRGQAPFSGKSSSSK
jgi:hypothetical protein